MAKLHDKNKVMYKPYKIQTQFLEMQKELKDKKKEIARGNRELEDLRKSEKAQYDKHEAELKKVHDRHDQHNLQNYSRMKILETRNTELEEKFSLLEKHKPGYLA